MGAKILPCTCSHEFQDTTYGKGNRQFSTGKVKESGLQLHRCTVCSRTVELLREK